MRRTSAHLWLSALSWSGSCLLLCAACGGATPNPENAPASGAPAAAVGNAVAAGVVWVSAGGCKLQGCPYGSYCNEKTGYCDVLKCSQGCPDGTVCNEGLDRCQAAPPAQTPRDTLPQDDARNFPGNN